MLDAHDFRELRLEIAYALAAPDPAAFADTGELTQDDFHLGLLLDDEATGVVSCYVDLGAVEAERRLEIFEDMLDMNRAIARRSEGMFCFDSEHGRAVLTTRFEAERFGEAQNIADYIRSLREFTTGLRRRWDGDGEHLSPPMPLQFNLA